MKLPLLWIVVLVPSLLIGCASADSEPDGEDSVTSDAVTEAASRTKDFVVPNLSDAEIEDVLASYAQIDPDHLVAENLRRDALVYYDVNKAHLDNPHHMAIVDFALGSGKKRFYLIDMQTGAVTPHAVAHGEGSEDGHGFATRFSDIDGSHQSSLGFVLTGEIYSGVHGRSLRLDGLSKTNAHMRPRAIVIHSADYVHENAAKQGNSNGCFALDATVKDAVVTALHDGALLYAGLGK